MRPGFKYVLAPEAEPVRARIDESVEDFAETEHYAARRYEGPDEFLAAFAMPWVLELHEVLRDLLSPERAVLSLGSGLGEHDVRLFLAGYDVVASDIVPGVLDQAVAHFPGFRAIHLDILAPDHGECYDDVLITGLQYAFDSARLLTCMRNARTLLRPGGRLIFVARYQDKPATFALDRLWPLEAGYRRAKARRRGEHLKVVKRHYGYRWSRRETVAMARRAGFRLGRTRHSGFGVELAHLDLDWKFPRAYRLASRLDRHLRLVNNATTFEFLT